jgi:hypothetical protein
MNVPTLQFDTIASEPLGLDAIAPVAGEPLASRLIAADCEFLDVTWEKVGSLTLCASDDVIFVCEAYNELPDVIAEGGQHVYLGDGALELTVTFSGGLSHIVQRHSRFLRRDFTTTTEYTASLERYVGAWHRLVRGIVELAATVEAARARSEQ